MNTTLDHPKKCECCGQKMPEYSEVEKQYASATAIPLGSFAIYQSSDKEFWMCFIDRNLIMNPEFLGSVFVGRIVMTKDKIMDYFSQKTLDKAIADANFERKLFSGKCTDFNYNYTMYH